MLAAVALLTPTVASSNALSSQVSTSTDALPNELASLQSLDATLDIPDARIQQIQNLAAAESLVSEVDASRDEGLAGAVQIARAATDYHETVLGVDEHVTQAPPAPGSPSEALLELTERVDVEPTPEQVERIEALDDLPEPLRTRLADFVSAFLWLETASSTVFPTAQAVGLSPVPQQSAAEVPTASALAPREDLATILAARGTFLNATLALEDALDQTDPRSLTSSSTVSVPPAFSLDLAGTASTYDEDVVLLLDVGGGDTYNNNAGGNNLAGGGCGLDDLRAAAALVDLGTGIDDYTTLRDCGANGGGFRGVGFLFDEGGSDAYGADDRGTNGGGLEGLGFLLDGGGSDTYDAGIFGTNGGGEQAGIGFLVDAAGGDSYTAGDHGVNGGADFGALGLLVDAEGDDAYMVSPWDDDGVNGGAGHDDLAGVLPAAALLLDAQGTDDYEDGQGGTGTDESVVPKGIVGAQLDLVPGADALEPPTLPPGTCPALVCVAIEPSSRIANLTAVNGSVGPDPAANITVEIGTFRVDAAGTFASQDVVLPRVDGSPDPALLEQDVGGVLSTSYTFEQQVCVTTCTYTIPEVGTDPEVVGELWNARFKVLVLGDETTNLPFAVVKLDP